MKTINIRNMEAVTTISNIEESELDFWLDLLEGNVQGLIEVVNNDTTGIRRHY